MMTDYPVLDTAIIITVFCVGMFVLAYAWAFFVTVPHEEQQARIKELERQLASKDSQS